MVFARTANEPTSPTEDKVEPEIHQRASGVYVVCVRPDLRVIGHPDLRSGIQFQTRTGLYISFAEAIARLRSGQEGVEIHWESTPADDLALQPYRKAMIEARRNDAFSGFDGWFAS